MTRNVPESQPRLIHPRVVYIDNASPKGFAANHNAAFHQSRHAYFCVLNPDIEWREDPYHGLIETMERTGAALAAPVVRSPAGFPDGSIRRFPTPLSLARKALGLSANDYAISDHGVCFFPEWVAGMFMLFRRSAYERLSGFDERFFLYYEDVDICVRAWKAGIRIVVCPDVSVVHRAQRASHRNLTFLRWHVTSMARYFWKHWGRLPRPVACYGETTSADGRET